MATLYAAKAQSNTTSDLYEVNPATAGVTSVGAIGFALTGLAQDPTTGVIYGVTSGNSASHPRALVTVNPGTGAGTLVADLSGDGVTVNDIAFRADGTLFGVDQSGDCGCTIDKATGVVTFLANGYTGTSFGNGNSFDSGDIWYAMLRGGRPNSPSTDRGHLFTIADTDGTVTDLGATTGGPANNAQVGALSFDPTDVLYGVYIDGSVSNLVTINVSSRAVTTIGDMGAGFDALAWVTLTVTPTRVNFGVQPSDACVDDTITPAVTVRIEDGMGTLDTSSTAAVTVAIGTNPGGGILSGTLTVNAVAGIATFNDLSIDSAGVGYTLNASSAGLTSDTSSAFTVSVIPANDLCANATTLSGVSGTLTATNLCAGHEASDPLDVWFGGTCKNTVFFKFTAAAAAYIELTISKPGGSAIDAILAGVAHGACGSLVIENDDLVNTPAYSETLDGGPPGTFGTPVEAGETVYIEVAVESGGDPGAFTLEWRLRTVTTYDGIDLVEQVGTDIIGPVDSPSFFSAFYAMYAQTADGRHWIGYADVVARDGGDLPTDIVCNVDVLSASGFGGWTSTTVDTFNDQTDLLCLQDHEYWIEGPYLVTDGTEMWALIVIRGGVGHTFYDGLSFCWIPEEFPSINIYHFNGASWDKIGFDESAGAVFLGGANPVFSTNIGQLKYTASANEPGVMYLGKSEQGTVQGRTWITKVDTAGIVWTADLAAATSPDTAASSNLLLANDGGSPVAFFVKPHTNYHDDPQTFTDFLGDPLDMYAIDPTTGAATLMQSQAVPGGASGGFDFAWASSPKFTDAMDSVVKYLVSGRVHDSGTEEVWVYQVAVDGSAAFEYMDNTIGHASFLPGGTAANQSPGARIWQDDRNVWIPTLLRTIFQFDRLCFNSWGGTATPGLVMPGTFLGATTYVRSPDIILAGSTFYGLAAWQPTGGTGNALDYTVFRLTIEPNLFCELGPDVVLSHGIYLNPRIIG